MSSDKNKQVTVNLETPITRGDTEIKSITLRKPMSGALRGISMRDVLDMNVDAMTVLLPRISEPPLNQHDIAQLSPFDLLQLGGTVAGFFMPQQIQAQLREDGQTE